MYHLLMEKDVEEQKAEEFNKKQLDQINNSTPRYNNIYKWSSQIFKFKRFRC